MSPDKCDKFPALLTGFSSYIGLCSFSFEGTPGSCRNIVRQVSEMQHKVIHYEVTPTVFNPSAVRSSNRKWSQLI
jgi:hypothetical protein